MKMRRSYHNIFAFVAAIALTMNASLSQAQPPSTPAEGPSEVKKAVTAPRVKPQVIYRLPTSSNDAAALHAQAKAENNALPIDSDMPTSLQLARSNANAAAAQTPTPGPSVQNQSQDTGGRKRSSKSSTARTKPAKAHTTGKGPGAKGGNKH